MTETLSKPTPVDTLFAQAEAWALHRAAMKRLETARHLLALHRANGPAAALLLEDAAKLYQSAFTQALGQEVSV